ncbi:MAG: hypothetical protein ROW52_03945 [Anaerolineaceae bacterium]|jgi:hypothetical protein
MRITHDTLRKIAAHTASERSRYNRHLVSIYLTGSLLEEDALLGGTADIDLIFIHDSQPPTGREILPVSDDIHVDIGHLPQSLFLQPRSLRGEAWLGSFLCSNPTLLHDTQHWFEFTQSVVCAQFTQPENVLNRARPLAEKARQAWMTLHSDTRTSWPNTIATYLSILKKSANSIACLSGAPLTDRRFMLQFPARAGFIGHPDLAETLAVLFCGQPLSDEEWSSWLAVCEDCYAAIGKSGQAPARLHPARRNYYLKAAAALWDSDHKSAALWLLFHTWTDMINISTGDAAIQEWLGAARRLGLAQEDFAGRMEALDAYLDQIEEALDVWAKDHGV